MNTGTPIALIGCGGMMGVHAQQILSRTDAHIAALCDINPDQISKFKARFPDLAQTPSLTCHKELLSRNLVEAVVIASPHTPHKPQIVDSFSAGVHVLCEKPLATTTEDVRACINARDRANKVGALAYQRHGEAPFLWIKSTIESGIYGKVRALNSHLGQQWYQFTAGTWRQQLAVSGGGQINDSGSHMIDVLLWMTGLEAKSVTAFMDNMDTEVDINSVVNIKFDTGALGTLTIVGDAALWHERHYIWLEEAMIALVDGKISVTTRNGHRLEVTEFPASISPVQNFMECLHGNASPMASFESGASTIALTEAAWKSAYGGNKPQSVLPFQK